MLLISRKRPHDDAEERDNHKRACTTDETAPEASTALATIAGPPKTGATCSEDTLVVPFTVHLSFPVPKGISLANTETNSWMVSYGRLYFADPEGKGRVVDAEPFVEDWKRPDNYVCSGGVLGTRVLRGSYLGMRCHQD